jgi:hypothetical protein
LLDHHSASRGSYVLGTEILTPFIVFAAAIEKIMKALCAVWCKFSMGEFAAAVDDVDVRARTSRLLEIVGVLGGYGLPGDELEPDCSLREARHTPGAVFLSPYGSRGAFLSLNGGGCPLLTASCAYMKICSCEEESG